MVNMNKFNAEFITSEYIELHHKRSKLQYSIREFITFTIQECAGETFNHYEAIYQKQQRKNAKTKKS